MRAMLVPLLGALALTATLLPALHADALCMARPRLSPTHREAQRAEHAGRYDDAAELYLRGGYRSRYLAANMWQRAGDKALLEGQFTNAASRFHRALDLQPGNPRASLALARALSFASRPVQALRVLDALPDAWRNRAEAKAARSRALSLMGRRREAARWAAEALTAPLPELDRRMLLQSGLGVRFTAPGTLGGL